MKSMFISNVDNQVKKEQLRLLYQEGLIVLYIEIVLSIATGYIFSDVLEPSFIKIWIAVILILNLFRISLSQYYLNHQHHDLRNQFWENFYLIGTLAAGSAWSWLGFDYYASLTVNDQIALIVIYFTLISIALYNYSIMYTIFLSFFTPIFIAIIFLLTSHQHLGFNVVVTFFVTFFYLCCSQA